MNDKNDAYFGFEPVLPAEKSKRVKQVFDSVASRYDLMNDLMSGGMHRLWKRRAMTILNPQPGRLLLDVAGGTGDLARLWLEGGGQTAIICDRSEQMLLAGDASDSSGPIRACADAGCLPLPDGTADAVSIAFGLRNMTDIRSALTEMLRVLKPGGQFVCLEFSRVNNALLRQAYDSFSFAVIPSLGRLVTGNENAYRYLIESIRRFPSQAELGLIMEQCGFVRVRHRNIAAGIVAIHSGWKI